MTAITPSNGKLTYEDVAAELGVSVNTVRTFVRRKRLRVIKLSKTTHFFRRIDVEKFVEKCASC